MGVYRDLLYPLKKILEGTSPRHFNAHYWERHANSPQHVHRLFEAYTDEAVRAHWELVRPLLKEPSAHVLDIGCGAGRGLGNFAKTMGKTFGSGTGIDVSSSILSLARKNAPEHRYLKYDLLDESCPVPEVLRHSAHFAFCHSVLHSVPKGDLPLFFARVREMVSDGGVVLFAWWAPYFIDETWIVPFVPMSHRHDDATVLAAMEPYFDTPEVMQKSENLPLGGGIKKIVRAALVPFHPKNSGVVVARARK